jgi:hypothetical protein
MQGNSQDQTSNIASSLATYNTFMQNEGVFSARVAQTEPIKIQPI